MRRNLPIYLFFLVISTFLQSQTLEPRKPILRKSTVESRRAGAFIDVNAPGYTESGFTIDKLVKDVLISSGTNTCVAPSVTNVQITPNHAVSNPNRSWGYFNKATTNFPFKDGILLSTGYAFKAGNSFESNLSDVNGGGTDNDLAQATGVSPSSLNDAVLLEFDFIPTTSQIKFNYILASMEYTGTYPCNYADAFAILLKPTSGGAYTNMAVLPGGAGPVSITNIHPLIPGSFGGGCPAVNEQYFGGYNTAQIETNFNGRTVPLTATATVIPGQEYHFKMVIADYGDHSFDSAVFLEGGSFNIGVELQDPSGATLPSDINVCDNVPQVITASVSDPNLLYQWYYNGTPVPGATTNVITATQPGTYEIEVSVPGNPCPGKASVEIHGGITPEAHDASYLLCTTADVTTFDLNSMKPALSSTSWAQFKFYENQADAVAQNNNNIQNILNYNGTDGQIIYVVVSNGGFCSRLVELKLLKEATPTATIKSSRVKVCPGETITLTADGGNTYSWVNFPGTGNTQTVTLQQSTVFTVYAIGEKGCQSLPATVRVEVTPEITSPLTDVEMCLGDKVTLDAGTEPDGYHYQYVWSTGATTQKITVDQWGIYTVEIDNGFCKKTFSVKVMGAATPYISAVNYDGIKKALTVIAENPPMNNMPSSLEYSIDNGITWQQSNIFSGLTDNTNYTILVRRVGTHCVGSLDIFTFQINNVITPNNDGINDTLDLKALGNFNNFTGSVYDRYGVEVFRFSKENPIWDGTVSGKRLPTATYWYKFNFTYPKSKTDMNWSGWIMLKNRE